MEGKKLTLQSAKIGAVELLASGLLAARAPATGILLASVECLGSYMGGAPQPCGWPLPRSAGILLAALSALASAPGIGRTATARTPPVAGHSSAIARTRETPSLGREKRRRFLENLGLLKNMRSPPRSEHVATPDKLHRTARPGRLLQCVLRALAQKCFYMLCAVVVSRPSTD